MTLRWLTVLLIACGTSGSERNDKAAGSGSARPTPSRTIELPEPAIVLPRELAFEVLEAGRGERVALRYALGASTSDFVTRTKLTSRELANGTWSEPGKLPAIVTPLGVVVEGGGRTTMRPRAGSIDGSPGAAASAYLASWEALAGTSFVVTLDARGRLGTLGDHDAASDELVQRLLATLVPVPDEAIGEGARWRVVTALRQQSAVLKQTATYTLVSRAAPWKIDVDIQRLAEPQRIGDVELVAIVRRLRGTLEIDPARPFARRGTLEVESTVHVRSNGRESIVEDTGSIELETRTSSTSR